MKESCVALGLFPSNVTGSQALLFTILPLEVPGGREELATQRGRLGSSSQTSTDTQFLQNRLQGVRWNLPQPKREASESSTDPLSHTFHRRPLTHRLHL